MNQVLPTSQRPTGALPNIGNVVGSAQEQKADFLNLLVTELRHQDPLNPMDSQAFASQLAQFSTLEELQNIGVKLDNALESDMILSQSINNTMAATLIGRDRRAHV